MSLPPTPSNHIKRLNNNQILPVFQDLLTMFTTELMKSKNISSSLYFLFLGLYNEVFSLLQYKFFLYTHRQHLEIAVVFHPENKEVQLWTSSLEQLIQKYLKEEFLFNIHYLLRSFFGLNYLFFWIYLWFSIHFINKVLAPLPSFPTTINGLFSFCLFK